MDQTSTACSFVLTFVFVFLYKNVIFLILFFLLFHVKCSNFVNCVILIKLVM